MAKLRRATDRRCEWCQFFLGYKKDNGEPDDRGECHRWAPRPGAVQESLIWFPVMFFSSFCGEFASKYVTYSWEIPDPDDDDEPEEEWGN